MCGSVLKRKRGENPADDPQDDLPVNVYAVRHGKNILRGVSTGLAELRAFYKRSGFGTSYSPIWDVDGETVKGYNLYVNWIRVKKVPSPPGLAVGGKVVNPSGEEIQLSSGWMFVPMASEQGAKAMARMLEGEGKVVDRVVKLGGDWGVVYKQGTATGNPANDEEKWLARQRRWQEVLRIKNAKTRELLEKKLGPVMWEWTNKEHTKGYAQSENGGEFTFSYNAGRITVKKSNPESDTQSMYESFHGEPSGETVEFEEQEHYHGNLASLGVLVGLKLRTVSGYDVTLTFDAGDGETAEDNPAFWEGLKKAIRGHSSGMLKYAVKKNEIAATALSARLGAQGVFNEVVQHRVKLLPVPKYEWEVWVDRGQIRELLEQKAEMGRGGGGERKLAHASNPAKFRVSVFSPGKGMHGEGSKVFQERDPALRYYHAVVEEGYKAVITQDDHAIIHFSRMDRIEAKHHAVPGKVLNPKQGPFTAAMKVSEQVTRYASKPIDKLYGEAGKVGGYLDRQLGKVLLGNPKQPDPKWALVAKDGKFLGGFTTKKEASKSAHLTLGLSSNQYSVTLWKKYIRQLSDGNRSNPALSSLTLLTSNESGTQLYFTGGDQSVDLASLKITGAAADKESITLGELWALNYQTRKQFDGQTENADYIHILGPKETKPGRGKDLWDDAIPPNDKFFGTGELPTLTYDRLNKRLKLSGGIYKIDQPLIGTSPGIVN